MEDQIKQPVLFKFEDLRVYHKSLDYFTWLSEQTKGADDYQNEIIVKLLMNSAMTIATNIAEGSSRHKLQFVSFLKDAKTAVRECAVFSNIAYNLGFFSEEQFTKSKEILIEITKMVGAMIVSLQRSLNKEYNTQKPDALPGSEIDFEY